jgi:TonB family protein
VKRVLIPILSVAALFQIATAQPQSPLHFQSAVQGPGKSQPTDLEEAARLKALVLQLYKEEKYKEALPLAQRAQQLRENNPTLNATLLHGAISDLGEIYLALRMFGEAESQFQRLIKAYEQSNTEDRRLPAVLERVALIRHARGSPDQAEDLYQRALQIREKVYGPRHAAVKQSIFNLAEFYQLIGNYKKADPLYQKLVSLSEDTSGGSENAQLAEALDRYACLMRKTGRRVEAEQLEARAYRPPKPASAPSAQADDNEEGVLNGRALSLPKPSYPADARAAGVSGTVSVRVTIDETGKVLRACGIRGHALLVRQSEIAAYGAKFAPTLLKGVPVKVTGIINYNYVRR